MVEFLAQRRMRGSQRPASAVVLVAVVALVLACIATPALGAPTSVVMWGNGEHGQRGNGEDVSSNVPVEVPGLSEVRQVSGREFDSTALLDNGTVMDWVGDGATPKHVAGLAEIIAIADGGDTNLELVGSGAVMEFSGFKGVGVLPVPGITNATSIAGGAGGDAMVLSDGTVRTFGHNFTGGLGIGEIGEDQEEPVEVCAVGTTGPCPHGPFLSGVKEVASGQFYMVALLNDGTLVAWGRDSSGELGDGPHADDPNPKPIPGLTGVKAIAAGGAHSDALMSDGTVEEWGNTVDGNGPLPAEVSGLSGVSAVSSGNSFSMALLANGTVMTWGGNTFGQLGDGTNTASTAPVKVAGLTGVTDIAACAEQFSGADHALAVITSAPTPKVTSVNPSAGPKGGGTSVTITGANFTGATAVKFGSTNATSFEVSSASSITAVSPAGTGTVDVTVTTPEGASATSPADQFAYGPNVTSVSPNHGPAGGGTSVAITGVNLSNAMAVRFGSVNATSFTVNSATSITAVSPVGTETVDVTVTTKEGTSPTGSADQFTYVPAPTVTEVSPNAGPEGGGTSVSITGTNLTGATTVDFGLGAATSFTVNSQSSITAVAPPGTGSVDVTVTSAGGTSLTSFADQFAYLPTPTVAAVEPDRGAGAGGTTVTITGTNLAEATAVTFGSTSAASFTVNSANSITAVSPAGTGTVDVTVTTPEGTSPTGTADLFSYLPAVEVSKVAPRKGPVAGGTVVTITGMGLGEATAVMFGSTSAISFHVVSATSITAVTPAESVRIVDVTVTTPEGTSAISKKDRFKYAPTITAVSPDTGSTTGGTSVTVTGTGFALGTTATIFRFVKAKTLAARSANVNCTSTTECTVVSPAHEVGTVDVKAAVNKVSSAKNAPADQFTYE